MSEDESYETEQVTDRETVADYLRGMADRIESGDPLPFGPDADGALAAESPVEFRVRSRAGDEARTRVRFDLSWENSDGGTGDDSSIDNSSDGNRERGEARERGGTRRGAAGGSSGDADLATHDEDLPGPDAATKSESRAQQEFERAVHFATKGKARPADSRFRQAITADPTDPEIRRQYATFLRETGDPGRARRQFECALSIDPGDVDVVVDLANLHWSQGDVEAATEQFERALDLEPTNTDVLSTYGRFRWEELDDVEGAVEHLREAMELDDDHALAHLNYAVLLRHGGRMDRAETHYERALELGEGDPTVHSEYGHYLWATGDVEAAARHYAKAEELGGG